MSPPLNDAKFINAYRIGSGAEFHYKWGMGGGRQEGGGDVSGGSFGQLLSRRSSRAGFDARYSRVPRPIKFIVSKFICMVY